MPSTKPLSINPPDDEARAEHWVATQGVARFDSHAAAPAKTLSAVEAGGRLRAHITRRAAQKKA